MQIHVALQVNRAGEKFAARDNDNSTAGGIASRNRFAESCAAIEMAIAHSSKFGYLKLAAWEFRRLDAVKNLRQTRPWIFRFLANRKCAVGEILCKRCREPSTAHSNGRLHELAAMHWHACTSS